MESKKENLGRKYWSSLAEYHQEPEFVKNQQQEFFARPQAFFEAARAGETFEIGRRDLLKLGGAALVFAAAGCARRPVEKIVPYLNAPEEITPGKPNWYASTCGGCAAGCGILVKTREARPIKLEGNPEHPLNRRGLCARGQAALLDLYDPDRARYPLKVFRSETEPEKIDWQTADSEIAYALATAQKEIVVLTGTIHGPARQKVIKEFLDTYQRSRHVVFDVFSEEELLIAQKVCYGTGVLPRYRFDKAEIVVFLGADPLAGGHSVTEFIREVGLKRKIKDWAMSQIISFEPVLSLTGSNADRHYLVRPGDLLKVALALANQLVVVERRSEYAGRAEVINSLRDFEPGKVEQEVNLPGGTIKSVANQLWNNRTKSLVFTGGLACRTEAILSLHIVTNFLNSILGNDGTTVDYSQSPSQQSGGSYSALVSLISEMQAGKVEVLMIYGINPAYSLPTSAGFTEAIQNVKTLVSFNDRLDETSSLADYLLPSLHFLESWGDAEPQKGLYSLTQPAIEKLHNNRGFEESLLTLAQAVKSGPQNKGSITWYNFLKKTWEKEVYSKHKVIADFEEFWTSALREGVFDTVDRTVESTPPRRFKTAALKLISEPKTKISDFSLVLYPPALQYDGRANNNAWLMETPDPVSKITWDNYLAVAPRTAEKLGLKENQVVFLTCYGFSCEIPVHIQPAVHPEVLAVAVGWGRQRVGRVGNKVGVNAYQWSVVNASGIRFSDLPAELKKTSRTFLLASVQGHNYINGRPIVYEASLSEYKENPSAGRSGEEKLISMWPEHKYEGHKWGMAIDLNSCLGCNACVLACQAENNVPVVGKDQVIKGREMAWIRIDRYYSGNPDNPEVTYQPMLCQNCENAPCETVCPVVATLHNEEGLNLQIYNRCVGTRYCSNNCPYKVRRFNWFENNQNLAVPLNLVLNPDVTVREKGVMEKCTFCIQRIRFSKEQAKDEGRAISDGEILTACQQTCPVEAIVFGDLNDPDSKVSKLIRDQRGYQVLEILNTKPAITYLTKIRNREET